jgi:hypothetical protein
MQRQRIRSQLRPLNVLEQKMTRDMHDSNMRRTVTAISTEECTSHKTPYLKLLFDRVQGAWEVGDHHLMSNLIRCSPAFHLTETKPECVTPQLFFSPLFFAIYLLDIHQGQVH